MAYRWGQQGPAFEFPTPYAIENRFLRLRAVGLIATAVLIAAVLAFVPASGADADSTALILSADPAESGPGSAVPHLLMALLLALLGVLEWVRAAAQRTLLLAPGEPASLTAEVRREAAGSSAGVPWLMQALQTGRPAAQPDSGVYSGLLNSLSPAVASAPLALRNHLRVRLGNLLLASSLLLLLLLAWGVTARWTPPLPGARAAIAGLLMLLGCALMVASRLGADQVALSPGRIAGLLLLALLGSGALGYVAMQMPAIAAQMAKLDQLALPLAAAVVLVGSLVIELMALLAGRRQLVAVPPSSPMQPHIGPTVDTPDATATTQADPQLVMQEIDRELHRRWTEGIPNRRHAWQPPQIDAQADSGRFSALVLEESQPMLPPGARALDWAACRNEPPLRGLLLLDVLGLLFTACACAGWLVLAWTHSHSMAAPWTWGLPGLMALLLGGHALHVAHLLWSRQEAQSVLTVLEMEGGYRRVGAVAAPGNPGPAGKADRSTAFDPWRLQPRVLQARSVFYAAGRHVDGSRILLGLWPDAPAAAAWAQQIQTFVRALPGGVAGDEARTPSPMPMPMPLAVPEPSAGAARAARPGRTVDVESSPQPRAAAARFCSACGTPLLQGARFCQQCGHQLPSG